MSNRQFALAGASLLAVVALGFAYQHYRKRSRRVIDAQSTRDLPCSDEFNAAVEKSRSLNVSDSATLLKLYGLYKRATVGKADEGSKPWEPIARAKWQAWHDCRDLSKEEAEYLYVDLVAILAKSTEASSQTTKKVSMAPKVSKMAFPQDEDIASGSEVDFEGMEEFDAARNDLANIREHLDAHPELIHCKDEESRTLLHWAVDSDDLDAVMLLIERGSVLNAKDIDGFTPLGYAASSDLVEIATLLYEAGSDVDMASPDQPAYELAKDKTLKSLLKGK